MPKARALDSEFKRQYETYTMADGKVYDSREINWHDIKNWDECVEITAHIKGHEYTASNKDKTGKVWPGFISMVRFRNGGFEQYYNETTKEWMRKPIDQWCIGWTDGEKAYVAEIDFHTGKLLRTYAEDMKAIRNVTYHPSLKGKLKYEPDKE